MQAVYSTLEFDKQHILRYLILISNILVLIKKVTEKKYHIVLFSDILNTRIV